MLVFDQLRKNDLQLRLLAFIVLAGMLLLLAGLWWVQLVGSKRYQAKLETQSVRTVRIPAVRGKILDHDGNALADSRPNYSINIYLQDLSTNFESAYNDLLSRAKKYYMQQRDLRQVQLGRKLTADELKAFVITKPLLGALQRQARYEVTSNMVANLSARLQQPITLTQKQFENHYLKSRALPLPILANLNPVQLARFEEQADHLQGMNLDVQPMRFYPYGQVAAHLLGYLTHNDDSDDLNHFNYRLPDFRGETGIEGLFDDQLQGIAGEKSVVVNYLGYRQSETILQQPEPGQNVVLTIEADIQKIADAALQKAQANVRGAVVVMDPQTGDVLAMASAPSYDPNHRIHPDPATYDQEQERWNDETLGLQRNRAIYENYHPGSIFKIVVGMAGLEKNTLNPDEQFLSEGSYKIAGRQKPIGDTAGPGYFDFYRAMAKSSNPYFINEGIKPGVLQEVVVLGQRLHLGERTGIIPRQETGGNFPTPKRINSHWRLGDTANLSIGQGEIDVTPVQMAVMTSAVANGGTVYWPRVVARIDSADGTSIVKYPTARVRDRLGVSPRTLRVTHDGMLREVESEEGTGHTLNIPEWRVAGKTGTAEVENRLGHVDKSLKDTWFASFAPEENPRYVVVATVEGGASGGKTCVPVAHEIYLALQAREHRLALSKHALAEIK